MVVMVVEHEGGVIGLAWAMADSYMLSDGPLFVTVQLIAVELEKVYRVLTGRDTGARGSLDFSLPG